MFNGAGTFVLVAGNPVVTGTVISTNWANNTLSDIANGLSNTITKDGQTTPTANIPLGGFKITNSAAATTNGDLVRFEQISNLAQAQFAQCVLTRSGANLLLSPLNGNQILINGIRQVVPVAGVSLAPTGTAAATMYYIYVFMVGAVMTLEFSTTVRAVDATTGMPIKSGDPTRTFVGLAVSAAAGAWSTRVLLVISYFNRRSLTDKSWFTTVRTSSNATYPVFTETNTEIQVPFLTFGNEYVSSVFDGAGSNPSGTSNAYVYSSIGFDSPANPTAATPEDGAFGTGSAVPGALIGCHAEARRGPSNPLSEGLHFATQLSSATLANCQFSGSASPGQRCALQVTVQG